MQMCLVRKLIRIALACAILTSTQACSTLPSGDIDSVADAYHSPDAIATAHYTRTIFSSTNF